MSKQSGFTTFVKPKCCYQLPKFLNRKRKMSASSRRDHAVRLSDVTSSITYINDRYAPSFTLQTCQRSAGTIDRKQSCHELPHLKVDRSNIWEAQRRSVFLKNYRPIYRHYKLAAFVSTRTSKRSNGHKGLMYFLPRSIAHQTCIRSDLLPHVIAEDPQDFHQVITMVSFFELHEISHNMWMLYHQLCVDRLVVAFRWRSP